MKSQFSTQILEHPTNSNINGNPTVRCTSDSNWYVSYNFTSDNGMYFLLFDNTGVCRRMELTDQISVCDFEILDNIVYFCGSYNSKGIFGYFNVLDFWSTSGTIYYHYLAGVETAYKICTYIDKNDQLPVAVIVGHNSASGGMMQSRGVYLYKINGLNYNGTYCPSSYLTGSYAFAVCDITVTDNYIVAAGTMYNMSNYLTLAIVEKNDLNTAHCYIIPESDLNAGALVEKLDGDNVALVDEVYNVSSSAFCDRIRTIDIPSYSVLLTQEIKLEEKTSPNDLLYVAPTNKLLMKQITQHGTVDDDFIYYVNPYSNSYMSDIVYDSNTWYNMMDQVGTHRFITVAGNHSQSTNHRFLIRDITALPQSQCLIFLSFLATPRKNSIMNKLSELQLLPHGDFFIPSQVNCKDDNTIQICDD